MGLFSGHKKSAPPPQKGDNHHGHTSGPPSRASTEMSRASTERHRHNYREQKASRIAERTTRRKHEEQDAKTRRDEHVKAYETDPAKNRYGHANRLDDLPERNPPSTVETICKEPMGKEINFRARIHQTRPFGNNLVIIVLRHRMVTIQAVLNTHTKICKGEDGGPSQNMVRFVERLPRETLVWVQGILRPPESKGHAQVKSADVHDAEVEISKLWVIAEVTSPPPFGVEEAGRAVADENHPERAEGKPGIGLHVRMEHRPLSLRTPTSHAIFRIFSTVTNAARSYLDSQNFIEIHSPKLQGCFTESGSSVFQVDYFQRAAFLAQSPQLAKEMSIGADFERVYEIGPVFRAENSNTHRHLTEFTGLDLEMALSMDYSEARKVLENMLKTIFRTVQTKCRRELEVVRRQFPSEDLTFPEETVIYTFRDAVKMLRDSGWREEGEEEGNLHEIDDFSTRAEVRVGQLIKEKHGTDFYIVDKFPTSVRPFYTMPDFQDGTVSNSFDFFVRGEEILSGGQRVHQARDLEARMHSIGIEPDDMQEYVDTFRWGMPPHAGGGIGLERLVFLYLNLGNIRHASLFPRDPRSFPNNPPMHSSALPKANVRLKTLDKGVEGFDEPPCLSYDPMKLDSHPPLEDLIAKYGDSTSTAWTDAAYEIWRDEPTGSAIGFVPGNGHAVTWGDPLCEPKELEKIMRAYLKWLHDDRKLGPIWLNASKATQAFLSSALEWRALSVTTEQIINLDDMHRLQSEEDKAVKRRVHRLERDGLKAVWLEGRMEAKTKAQLDAGIESWKRGRKGEQVHTTEVRPYADARHRTFLLAKDKNDKVLGFLVLHQLAPQNGVQIKWCLGWPDSPSGTTEYLLHHAIEHLVKEGVGKATFGAGAREKLLVVDNIKGFKAKILSEVYSGIVSTFRLVRKSEFRRKFGTTEESIFVVFPHGGLGVSGIKAIMNSVREPESAKSKAAKHQKRKKVTNKVSGAGHPQAPSSSSEKATPSTPNKGTPTKANGASTPAH